MRFALLTMAMGMWLHALPSHGITHANTDKDMINHKEAGLSNMSQATFGGGCFWCIDAVFSRIKGVQTAVPGYAGGHATNPSYREVSMGNTGHAEVVQVTFDAEQVSYLQLLEVFFRIHDPTTPNRQGADIGPQYRSIILYHDDEQRQTAEKVKDAMEVEKIWDDPVVTEIVPLDTFYEAEEEHQDYFEKNPDRAYCQMVILPKVEKFKSMFNDLLDTEQ